MAGMTVPIILFVLVGGFTALVYFGSADRKGKTGNGAYDERQIRAQGRAYMWGFYAMIAAGFGVMVLDTAVEGFISPTEATVFVMSFGIAVMAVYCVIHDAFISLKGSGPASLVSSGILAAICLSRGIEKLREAGPVTDGHLGPCWAHFALAAECLAVLLSLIVKMLINRRRGE